MLGLQQVVDACAALGLNPDKLPTGLLGVVIGSGLTLATQRVARKHFAAKLVLSFERSDDCIALTPAELFHPRTGGRYGETTGYWVRVRAVNSSYFVARNCRAYIVNVEKRSKDGTFTRVFNDSIPLSWACRGQEAFSGIDMPKDVPIYFDVFSTTENLPDRFELTTSSKPYRYEKLGMEPGTYRLTCCVGAEEAQPVQIQLLLEWRGRWDDFDVVRVEGPRMTHLQAGNPAVTPPRKPPTSSSPPRDATPTVTRLPVAARTDVSHHEGDDITKG